MSFKSGYLVHWDHMSSEGELSPDFGYKISPHPALHLNQSSINIFYDLCSGSFSRVSHYLITAPH